MKNIPTKRSESRSNKMQFYCFFWWSRWCRVTTRDKDSKDTRHLPQLGKVTELACERRDKAACSWHSRVRGHIHPDEGQGTCTVRPSPHGMLVSAAEQPNDDMALRCCSGDRSSEPRLSRPRSQQTPSTKQGGVVPVQCWEGAIPEQSLVALLFPALPVLV